MSAWLAKEGITKTRAAQYGYAVRNIQRWLDERGPMMVSEVNPVSTADYIAMRLAEGISGETINSELAALSRSMRWGELNGIIPYAPRVATVPAKDRSGPKELEYSPEQVAALLEASQATMERNHVFLFTMIMLSTHGRVEAVLELFGEQIKRGLIYFNAPGRTQTSKRRSIVPVSPSLSPWLPASGKVITYRTKRKDGSIYERPTYTIRNAFDGCLVEAGIVDQNGKALGSPNTLRHTIHTYLQTAGVPQAQIDAAAGHSSERGSGRNYTHLRPEYLKDFIDAVEGYWSDMERLTRVHRSQVGPKVIDLGSRRVVK